MDRCSISNRDWTEREGCSPDFSPLDVMIMQRLWRHVPGFKLQDDGMSLMGQEDLVRSQQVVEGKEGRMTDRPG